MLPPPAPSAAVSTNPDQSSTLAVAAACQSFAPSSPAARAPPLPVRNSDLDEVFESRRIVHPPNPDQNLRLALPPNVVDRGVQSRDEEQCRIYRLEPQSELIGAFEIVHRQENAA